jgi:antirestriction protein ArdC
MPTQAEIRSRITTEIIEALQSGNQPPWRMPWSSHPNGRGLPANAVSKRGYSGINPLLLTLHARRHGFRPRYWATFNQWVEMGATVMHRPHGVPAGQWGCQVVFFRPIKKTEIDKRTGEEKEVKFPLLRTYTLFNADQIHGAEKFQVPNLIVNSDFVDYEPAEVALGAYPADVRHGGDRAFYNQDGDYIQLPEKHRFPVPVDYYATLAHEMAHHSQKRLGWTGSYALAELRAEMAACFLMAELGIPQGDDMANHHAYLASWLEALQSDPRHLFSASSAASKAAAYILSFGRPAGDVEETEAVLAC